MHWTGKAERREAHYWLAARWHHSNNSFGHSTAAATLVFLHVRKG